MFTLTGLCLSPQIADKVPYLHLPLPDSPTNVERQCLHTCHAKRLAVARRSAIDGEELHPTSSLPSATQRVLESLTPALSAVFQLSWPFWPFRPSDIYERPSGGRCLAFLWAERNRQIASTGPNRPSIFEERDNRLFTRAISAPIKTVVSGAGDGGTRPHLRSSIARANIDLISG
jgi:hypothetical protein